MNQAVIIPLLYFLLVGSAWSALFRKKFADALAPALMLHMIVVMLCGMVFHNLSVGIYGGVAAFASVLVWRLAQTRPDMKALAHALWNDGVFVFFVLYLFCLFSNYGKRFIDWDEFGHWGIFLKESLRLDMLYVESPLPIFHKDYVPATTLFEVIWCRLCGRFLEADAYRAIQMVMFSMMLPMFNSFVPLAQGSNREQSAWNSVRHAFSGRGNQFAAVVFVLLLPLLFRPSGSKFYHSIYADYFLGVVFFYCAMESLRDYSEKWYQSLVLSIAFATLLLSKQTGIALLPLVFVLYFAKLVLFDTRRAAARQCYTKFAVMMFVSAAAPLLLWYLYIVFANAHIPSYCAADNAVLCQGTDSNMATYSGFRGKLVIESLKSPNSSSIERLKEFQETFVNSVFFARDILLHGSFMPIVIFISMLALMLALTIKDAVQRRKIRLAAFFIFASSLLYILLMYILYVVTSPVELYLILAGFERYMGTFIQSVMLLTLWLYFDSGAWKKHLFYSYAVFVLTFGYLLFFHVTAFSQMLPGSWTHDRRQISGWEYAANRIMSVTPENAKIYVIKRERAWTPFRGAVAYYASPRSVHVGNIGPAINPMHRNSTNLAPEQLQVTLKNYDYLYFSEIDQMFVDKYYVIFERPELLKNDSIYKITSAEGGVIALHPVGKAP